MHTARQFDASHFAVTRDGRPASRDDLLPDWGPLDRLAVVVTEPFGAVGASHLIQLSITAFYDVRPSRRAGRLDGRDPRAVYPEIYLIHVGEAHGDHSAFDFWPARKEVVVGRDPRLVLDAINDRAITRLAVPDVDRGVVAHEWKEPAAARDRILTALAYSPTGRVRHPTWEIAGTDARTERNVELILDPARRYASAASRVQPDGATDPLLAERSWARRTERRRDEGAAGLEQARRRRAALLDGDGLATESYAPLTVDQAIEMLVV
jgi:hypothetical protein